MARRDLPLDNKTAISKNSFSLSTASSKNSSGIISFGLFDGPEGGRNELADRRTAGGPGLVEAAKRTRKRVDNIDE